MRPQDYYQQLIGMDEDASWYNLPSPFPKENLQVVIADFLDTSYRGRVGSGPELTELIYRLVTAKPGNYLVFFPSYEYLNNILELFTLNYPDVNLIHQSREMDEDQRQDFTTSFESSAKPLCGFAVMGGIFAEGIDLKGESLIGAVVVGVGLPQLGIERDLIRDHFPHSGFEYAYQYPGMTRVLQTAGRVIRDENDRGVVCLVDKRFSERRYIDLLPQNWSIKRTGNVDEVSAVLSTFWTDPKN